MSKLKNELQRITSLAGRVALWSAAGYLVAAGALWHFQDALLLHPSESPRASHALVLAGQYIGDRYEPASLARGTVVFYHGNGGSTADRVVVGEGMAAAGYRAVLVEYPGYGSRDGQARSADYAARGVADFDLVRMQYPGQPLVVAGESFGAGVAAAVIGARAPDVCGAVLITPWNRLAELVQEKVPIFPARLLLKAEYASDLALLDYAGPVTIVAAQRDVVIPMHHAHTLAQRLPGSRFEVLAGAGHNDWYAKAGPSAWLRWLPRGCVQ